MADSESTTKHCGGCDQTKPLTEFHRNKGTRDGKTTQCKSCACRRAHRFYVDHPEQAKEMAARWTIQNPEKAREAKRQRYLRNQKRHYENHRRWLAAHPGKAREYARTWWLANKDVHSERVRKWAEKNSDKRHAYTMAHRARKRAAFVESVNRKVVYERDGGKCGVCGLHVKKTETSLDHIIPLSRGGEHSYKNIQLTHGRCNSSKGTTIRQPLVLET